jgi:hypothetical protein
MVTNLAMTANGGFSKSKLYTDPCTLNARESSNESTMAVAYRAEHGSVDAMLDLNRAGLGFAFLFCLIISLLLLRLVQPSDPLCRFASPPIR